MSTVSMPLQPRTFCLIRSGISNHRVTDSGANTAGVGARIEVSGGGLTQVREIRAGNQYVSQGPAEAHFGLGQVDVVDITVYWPDGTQSDLMGVAVDQVLIIDRP